MVPPDEQEPRSGLFAPESGPAPRAAAWLFVGILVFALALRLVFLGGPWSGIAQDFHSHFGAWAVGEPAERFATEGFAASGAMPVTWSVELADGTLVKDVYAHHPALYTILVGLSLKVFGLHEWAVRLVPLVFSLLALIATWRLVRRLYGSRAALFAAALLASVPYLAWYGMLAWTEGALIWIAMGQLGAYARWLEDGRRRHLMVAAGWQLLAGLFDWSGAFLLVGIALHAIFFRLKTHGLRASLPLLVLPAAFLVAVLVHWLHMYAVMTPEQRAHDTGTTLDTVTSLTTSLPHFLSLQVRFVWRFLGAPAALLALLGLGRAVFLAMRRKLTRNDHLVFVMLVPGLLYVGLFPQRSVNHDFFGMLSLPGFAVLAACGAAWIASRFPSALGRTRVFVLLAVLVLGIGTERSLATWSARRSDQMPHIAAAFADVLDDPGTVVLNPLGRGMALPFYARAEMLYSVDRVDLFEARMDGIVRRLAPDRQAYFLFDLLTAKQLLSGPAAERIGGFEGATFDERLSAFLTSRPPATLHPLLESFLFPDHQVLYQRLARDYPSRLVGSEAFGVFELFDLRASN